MRRRNSVQRKASSTATEVQNEDYDDHETPTSPPSQNLPTMKLFECLLDIMRAEPEKKWTLAELAEEANDSRYKGKVVNLMNNKIYSNIPEYSIQRCMCAKKQDVFAKDRNNRWSLQKGLLTSDELPKKRQISDVYKRPESSTLINLPSDAPKKKFKKLWECIVEEMQLQPKKEFSTQELVQILNSTKYRGTILNNSFSGKAYDTISDLSVKVCLSAKQRTLFEKIDKDLWMLQSKFRRKSKRKADDSDEEPRTSKRRRIVRQQVKYARDESRVDQRGSIKGSQSTRRKKMKHLELSGGQKWKFEKNEIDSINPDARFFEEPTLSYIC